MPQPPVILLTFSNDLDAYLTNLKQESAQINQALSALEDRGAIRIYREESVNTQDLLQAFIRFDGAIAGFHYAGHAHGQGLRLEDMEGQAEGLAQLISRQKNIQFVFLNGCSTLPQVNRLLQLGVPAVIATSTPINDTKATEFAASFYEKLANRGSLRQAFDFACDSLQLKHHSYSRPIVRGISSRLDFIFTKAQLEESLPWGIYYNEAHPQALEWTLPLPIPPALRRTGADSAYEVNEYLYAVLEEMARYDPSIEEELTEMEDDREYFEMIIKNFPWNIGSQFGLLVGEKEAGLNRIQQIISTYTACCQWLYFAHLSQLWKERSEQRILQFKLAPSQVFTITEDNFLTFDYVRGLVQILKELRENDIQPFVEELWDLLNQFQKGNALYDAYLFLESLREQLVEGSIQETQNIAGLCADAEFALGEMLCRLAFLVNYQMITVRDIVVFNPRHVNAKYFHKMGRLNAHTDERLFFFRNPKQYDDILDSDSVLLLKDLNNIREYLSLSPFFIDRNAFRDKSAELTDLYTFAYSSVDPATGERSFHYLKSSRNLLIAFQNKLDQLHTSEEVVSDVRRRGARGLKNRPHREGRSQQPYGLLREQFIQLIDLLK